MSLCLGEDSSLRDFFFSGEITFSSFISTGEGVLVGSCLPSVDSFLGEPLLSFLSTGDFFLSLEDDSSRDFFLSLEDDWAGDFFLSLEYDSSRGFLSFLRTDLSLLFISEESSFRDDVVLEVFLSFWIPLSLEEDLFFVADSDDGDNDAFRLISLGLDGVLSGRLFSFKIDTFRMDEDLGLDC